MARPIKQSLDYFPFDIDFFSDEKIVAICGEFGIKGEITAIKLLCAVYRNGYFVEWTEMLKYKLLKELPGVSAGLLDNIVSRLVKWGFFNKDLFDTDGILTSRGIQKRYQAISSKMHRKYEITDFCLLEEDSEIEPETEEAPKVPKPQKKRKPKKEPECEPEPVVVAEVFPQAELRIQESISVDMSVRQMLSDNIWGESVRKLYKLDEAEFKQSLETFRDYCRTLDKSEHTDIKDAKQHFCNLLKNGTLVEISNIKQRNNGKRTTSTGRHTASDGYEERKQELVDYVARNLGKD